MRHPQACQTCGDNDCPGCPEDAPAWFRKMFHPQLTVRDRQAIELGADLDSVARYREAVDETEEVDDAA